MHLQGPCEFERLPSQVFVGILMLLDQQELLQTVPLVCSAWQQASHQAMERLVLTLSSPERQQQLPYMFTWLQEHGRQLKQLQLSTSTPLGRASRKALLRSLVSQQCQQQCRFSDMWTNGPVSINSITNSSSHPTSTWGSSSSSSGSLGPVRRRPHHAQEGLYTAAGSTSHCKLQLQELVLQMDLDVMDLLFLANHVVQHAPQLRTLRLQPLKPSLADLQLLVLACIVGNLVGADAPGAFCSRAVAFALGNQHMHPVCNNHLVWCICGLYHSSVCCSRVQLRA